MIRFHLTTDKLCVKIFPDFMRERDNFPYSKEDLAHYIEDNIDKNDHYFILGTKDGIIGAVGFTQEVQLPSAYHVVFMCSRDPEVGGEMILFFCRHAKVLGYDQIQFTTHHRVEGMLKRTGTHIVGHVCGYHPDEGIEYFEKLLEARREK